MHNIDAELLEAMAEVESGGDPLSISPKRALGLMQLIINAGNPTGTMQSIERTLRGPPRRTRPAPTARKNLIRLLCSGPAAL
jgi:hypothetical protein